jgi:hypothetical protein
MSPRRAVLSLTAGALSVLVTAAVAHALEVQITTVRAAEHGSSDAQLEALRPRLRRLVGYRSFQVVRDERRRCSWQNTEAFKIPGGRLLNVFPKGMRDQAVVMQVKLVQRRRALVDTDVRLQNRGVMLFAVDRNSPEVGGALIIMLRAED